ncbi:25963_t:CDS:2 [Dentiscutata erythropus]|uniref:25963_t:CDS:1 n=1 Tax=Dentiscutata erythropus TaxID=1348616 RepID=A0A9N9FHS5_9GLOM|nr:25963_t:CDS:2 [Dentiscutata erythropus]
MTDEEPLTPVHPRTSITQSSAVRDSVITYSTDVVGSSSSGIGESRTNTFSSKQRSQEGSSTPFYRRKRFWVIYVAVNLVLAAIFIPLFIFAIFPAIAQSAINSSRLNINHINLTNIREESVAMSSDGNVTNAGPFASTISFDDPISMIYNDQEMAQVYFDPISSNGGYADLLLNQRDVKITNKDVFGNFSLNSFTQDNITIRFKGSARVKAMGITKSGLVLDKEVILVGGNNFPNVNVIQLNITQEADSQGSQIIAISHVVQLYNPSIFYVDMGQLGELITYNGSNIANMTIDDFILQPGVNNISMSGYVIGPSSPQDLSNLGKVMQAYITNNPIITQAKGVYAYPDYKNSVSWLTSVITQMTLNAVIGNSSLGTQVITGVDLGSPGINFVGQPAYAPLFSSQNITSSYVLPMKINSTILQVSQNISLLTQDGQAFAYLNTSVISVDSDNGSQIRFNSPSTTLYAIPDKNELFGEFLANLTKVDQEEVYISGSATILSRSLLGEIPIEQIPFTVPTTLRGFSNFSQIPPIINNVTVLSATPNYLVLGINATIYDTSTTSISLDNTTFQISYENAQVGLATGNLSLVPGPSNVYLTSTMDPKNSNEAYLLLSNFLNNINSTVTVSGFDGSTDIDSLKLAFQTLTMNSTLVPLSQPIVAASTLHILDTTPKDGVAQGNVTMSNPLDAKLTIRAIQSNITAGDFALATVSQSNLNIEIPGKQSTVTNLPITLNLDPAVLFGLLRQEAELKNISTDVIDILINIGQIQVPGVPSIDITKIDTDIFKNFNVLDYAKSVIGDINTIMTIFADVSFDDQYEITLPMTQNVTAHTDDSLAILVSYLSIPVAENLVNGSEISFSSVQIQKPSETGFTTVINGELNINVDIPGQISTPNGVALTFGGATLGTVNLPTITLTGKRTELDITSPFTISDKDALAEFTQKFLQADKISWSMVSPSITVSALGIDIKNISFDKNVQLNGANGFKNAVNITSFALPGDDPKGGISTAITATLSNPGTIGVELGELFFDVVSNNTKIGEVAANDVVLKPNDAISLNLNGRLIPQTSDDGLEVIQQIFNEFLAVKEIPLSTKGTDLNPPISWLVSGVRSLTIDTVLPAQKFPPLITSISLDDLELAFTPETAYNPNTSSKKITASLQIPQPLGFTLNISKIAQEVTLDDMAKLVIPLSGAISNIDSKAHTGTVTVSYDSAPLQVFPDAHDKFNSFVKVLTLEDSIGFGLKGTTEAHTLTAVGPIILNTIPVDVKSTLPGFQGFTTNNTPVNSIDVISGTPQALLIDITTSLFNPSTVSTDVGDVAFDFIFKDQKLGFATMTGLNIIPGVNNINATVTLAPQTPDAIQAAITMFANYIAGQKQETVIVGTENSTKVDSLKEAFSALKLQKDLLGLDKPLIVSAFVHLNPDTINNSIASGNITMDNPFTADITLTGVINGTITFHDILLGSINQPTTPPITFIGKSKTTSPAINTTLNLNPKDLINIIKLAAKDAGVNCTLPFTEIDNSGAKPSCDNLTDVILYILQQMKVDLTVEQANTTMDQYGPLPLPLKVNNLPVIFDESALLLMDVLARPVAQANIDKSVITMTSSFITDEYAKNFSTHTVGKIANAGTLQSSITYPSGLALSFNNKTLGSLTMPPTNITGNSSEVPLISDSRFSITDPTSFLTFSAEVLLLPQIKFSISADDLTVSALGKSIPNLKMNKELTIDGFNGLQDVKLIDFKIPSNTTILITSTIANPSHIGADMGKVNFNLTSSEGDIGPLVADDLILQPKQSQNVSFVLTPNFPDGWLTLLKLILRNNETITIKGVSVEPKTGDDVPWLNVPIQGYKVTLPFALPDGVRNETLSKIVEITGKHSNESIINS